MSWLRLIDWFALPASMQYKVIADSTQHPVNWTRNHHCQRYNLVTTTSNLSIHLFFDFSCWLFLFFVHKNNTHTQVESDKRVNRSDGIPQSNSVPAIDTPSIGAIVTKFELKKVRWKKHENLLSNWRATCAAGKYNHRNRCLELAGQIAARYHRNHRSVE